MYLISQQLYYSWVYTLFLGKWEAETSKEHLSSDVHKSKKLKGSKCPSTETWILCFMITCNVTHH